MTDGIRVLVVDDHPIVRDGLAALLTSRDEIEAVEVATDGAAAVARVDEWQPDVVVMDLHMPGVGGVEATAEITRSSPHVAVLILTMLDDDDSLFAAMRAGARGYLVKGAAQDEILRAVLAVASGEAIFGPAVAGRVLDYFFREPPGQTNKLFPELTERERQVLELIAHGLSNPVIGERLGLSEKTVRNYVSNVFTKLHVADRARAIVLARDAGMGKPVRK